MILYEQKLVDSLRKRFDAVNSRIWIASPFIGDFHNLPKIMGDEWKKRNIDFKILTDIDFGFIHKDSYKEFRKYHVDIASLSGLHAKIYIIDDYCLISSANLTGTAFSSRYEIGVEVSGGEQKTVEQLFLDWWKIAKKKLKPDFRPKGTLSEYQDGNKMTKKWKLPPYKSTGVDRYLMKCRLYKEFADIYASVTKRNQNMVKDGFSLLQEVDYFFNYLYHDHPGIPTNKFNKVRLLTPNRLKSEILKYFKSMPYQCGEGMNRIKSSLIIQNLLSSKNVHSLNSVNVDDIIRRFHCYSSLKLNIKRFETSNRLEDIITEWDDLLHSKEGITSYAIEKALSNLRFFGTSAVQELIAWYYPEEYPMMNSNSDCGMRFFGYDVK